MPELPRAVDEFKQNQDAVWKAFTELAERCHEGGPLDEKTRRLVKLALAVGAGLEGGTHSAVRHCLSAGITIDEMKHVAILGITTLGLPASMRALTWISDHLR
jgi:alkylhydroperoxidase/carboxymuconolactone decarboxylase family protein YurZ